MQEDKIVKISEEQAKEMFKETIIQFDNNGFQKLDSSMELTLNNWKKEGFIEESNLDKARDQYDFIVRNSYNENYKAIVKTLKDLYEKYIKEQQDILIIYEKRIKNLREETDKDISF